MALVSIYDAFAPVYSDWSADMTEDVPFYVELARETEGPLVELAVGRRPFTDDSPEFVWVTRKPM